MLTLRRRRARESSSERTERLEHNRRVREAQRIQRENRIENIRSLETGDIAVPMIIRRPRARETSFERTERLEHNRRVRQTRRIQEENRTENIGSLDRSDTTDRMILRPRRARETSSELSEQFEHNQNVRQVQEQNTIEINHNLETNDATRQLHPHTTYLIARKGIRSLRHYLGSMSIVCPDCGALHFPAEKSTQGHFNSCCNQGNIQLPLFSDFPDSLRELMIGSDNTSREFRNHIRNYNNSLAMATMCADLDIPRGNGPYCYRVHGMVYHRIGSLRALPNQIPMCGQVLIMDTAQAAAELAGRQVNSNCNIQIFIFLHSILVQFNPFVQAFKIMDEVVREQEGNILNRSVCDVRMVFSNRPGDDMRRYNIPTSNEIAAIFVGDDQNVPPARRLTVYERDGNLKTISDIDMNCDPLSYPLLFPNGQLGWHPDLQKNNSNRARVRISQREYYAFYLFPRKNSFNPFFHASKLFQQYLVDSWMKTEQNRVNYYRTHQSELRLNHIQGLEDELQSDPARELGPTGRRFVLPVSHQGGPRNMVASYQDAMTIVSRFGKPDIFLTFTCNPAATEIVENLEQYQNASDRPDLVARVFKLKLDALKDDLFKKHIFGKVLAHISVIEFQKRGLPHCHMLIILASQDKFSTSNLVDDAISAELPDPAEDQELFELVSKTMLHRPCGIANPSAPCMVEGKCSKGFPKKFSDQTNIETDGYPVYKRRNNGRVAMVSGVPLDNSWVVPYSPYLSRRYDAHINVEMCSNIVAVKYLYKYVYKGTDRARVALNSDNPNSEDELHSYLDSRYICSPEAAHRLFGFSMQEKSHSIVRLQVHLPGFNQIVYRSGDELAALQTARDRDSTLTAWFKLNETDINARQYFYYEIPEHYVKNTQNVWKKRVRSVLTLGRMVFVSPRQQERFALRLLLLNVKGATSFESLRTIDAVVFPTFSEAAKAAGLMIDNSHAKLAMEEATTLCMPVQIRALFVTLLAFIEVPDPTSLWNGFKSYMCEDFLHKYSHVPNFTTEMAESLAFSDVLDRMKNLGLHPTILNVSYNTSLLPNLEIMLEEIDYKEHERIGKEMYDSLNDEQKYVVDSILLSSGCFFIDGPGGSGKTFVYNTLYHIFFAKKLNIQCIAWTGIAANLLPKGQTVCSTFKLSVPQNDQSTLSRLSAQGRKLFSTDIFIWDEAPMAPRIALETVDSLLRDIMQNELPFGGKIMILGGDFRQILPVVEKGDRTQQISQCIKFSSLWQNFRQFRLRNNMRVQDPAQSCWKDYLLEIGEGKIQTLENGFIPIPTTIRCHSNLVDKIFDSIETSFSDLSNIAILTSTNSSALLLNEQVLNKLPGATHTSRSIDEVITETPSDALNFPTEVLNRMTPSGMPPHVLNLKKGAIVMLLRNLNVKDGLCNGTRLIVQEIGHRILSCTIATGSRKGENTFIPRIDCYYDNHLPFKLRRRQFPVRLSFAMTINKSQGQSFDRIGLCLNDRIFSHGQLYVALSRARSQDGIFIESDEDSMNNVVYKEVL